MSTSVTEGRLTFIDLFAGAGGLSLGLMQAGLAGMFGAEKEANAFATLQANLIEGVRGFKYDWPKWLPQEATDIQELIKKHASDLRSLRGKVDVLAGGPPCQGFSSAGRRQQADPRNLLFKLYIQVAELLQPTFLVFENVPGITMVFDKQERSKRNPKGIGRPAVPYSERIAQRLNKLGYEMVGLSERAADFGVPQNRVRYLMFGVRRDTGLTITPELIRELLMQYRDKLLGELDLKAPVTLKDAISDLETAGRRRIPCEDSPGFEQIEYAGPETHYQRLMHEGMSGAPNSIRLANQKPETVARLAKVLTTCRKGVRITKAERTTLGVGKESLTPLAPDLPAKTITSLPDDFVHYSEPRILTVRESARIQSFPDWFSFHGKYTTGGPERRYQVPRYTQVANAVPPLLARVIGLVVRHLHDEMYGVDGDRSEDDLPAVRTV